MRIGFIKLGVKTYFNKSGSGEGGNHELVDVFRIFEKNGHDCFMLSNNDIDPEWKNRQNLLVDLDWIFVFNGMAPNKWETNMNMLQGSLESLKYLKYRKDIPYAYFWTDPRYDIEKNPIFKEIPPKVILSQEPKHYAHLDKLILYEKNPPIPFEKDIFFSILMNDTKETVRRKSLSDVCNWLRQEGKTYQIKGKWNETPDKNYIPTPLKEEEVMQYLARVKYSFNCGKKEDWVSQKYWEMLLNGVICFYTSYDSGNLLMCKSDSRRVKDGIDVVNNIKRIENNPVLYKEHLSMMKAELKPEYFDGSFIYKIIINKLKI